MEALIMYFLLWTKKKEKRMKLIKVQFLQTQIFKTILYVENDTL